MNSSVNPYSQLFWTFYILLIYIITLRFAFLYSDKDSALLYFFVYSFTCTIAWVYLFKYVGFSKKYLRSSSEGQYNDLANLDFVAYDFFASEEQKREDLDILYQSPPRNIINTADYVMSLSPHQGKTITHKIFGDCLEILPGDIIFHEREEFMVVTTQIDNSLGVFIMVAGLVKMGDI